MAYLDKVQLSGTTYDLTDSAAQEALTTKAEINGYYEGMTVGDAEQLVATVGVEDKAAYTFRTSGGNADIGNRVQDKLVGGTIVWNQLLSNPNSFSVNGATKTYDSTTMTATVTATTVGHDAIGLYLTYGTNVVGHKYLLCADVNPSRAVRYQLTAFGTAKQFQINASTFTYLQMITNATNSGVISFYANAQTSSWLVGDSYQIRNIQLIDLTQMFGSTIADYIYSLEQAHAGDGVAYFRNLFPKTYYAYNAGTLMSVKTSAHQMTGFNQWDEVTEYGYWNALTGNKVTSTQSELLGSNRIAVLPSTDYFFATSAQNRGDAIFYDADDKFIGAKLSTGNKTFTTPDNCRYMRINLGNGYGSTYKNDICINIRWSGYRNGEYEPYELHTVDLDPVELRGLPTLVDGELQYDGDTYESDGTVTRRVAVVDLGSLTWGVAQTQDGWVQCVSSPANITPTDNAKKANILAYSHFAVDTANSVYARSANNTICISSGGAIQLYSSALASKTAEEVKSALSGIYLIYETKEPTTEEAAIYANPQWVDDFGTEEYVDAGVAAGTRDVAIPVGHESLYTANLRDKLQHLPSPAESDGDYLIREKNQQMRLLRADDAVVGKASVARSLESTVYEEDSVPYKFRTSGGSADIGDVKQEEIVGGTIVWNQLAYPNTNGGTSNGITFTPDTNGGKITATGTATGTALFTMRTNEINVIQGHKYLVTGCPSGGSGSTYMIAARDYSLTTDYGADVGSGRIFNASSSSNGIGALIRILSETSVNNIVFTPQIFDLTQMFGSAVADYIYTLETGNAGAGVAYFRSLFPKSYYEYNAGELMHVSGLRSHDTVGFNQWDEEWETGTISPQGEKEDNSTRIRTKNFIPCFPSTVYYAKTGGKTIGLRFYDKEKTLINQSYNYIISDNVFGTPPGAYYMMFSVVDTTTYSGDICINISWSGYRNGEYLPYEKHFYALDSDLVLRGVSRIDANNHPYYDGDVYQADGTVRRKYGVVDLGTMNWSYNSAGYFIANAPSDIAQYATRTQAFVCSIYTDVRDGRSFDSVLDKSIYNVTATPYVICVKDSSYTDAATFKTAVSEKYLVYELQSPETEQAEPYQSSMIVNDFGTEEFVSESIVPVGHNTKYTQNLRDKLQRLPDLPSSNGDYLVRYTNGQAAFVASPIPAAPSGNGNYRLKCTVSGSSVTYSWEVVS